jgi:fructosamine-3-kinase
VRKETDRLKNEILNEAAEIKQNSTATSTVIMAKAEAEALVKVEEARNVGLAQVFSSLNISSETHKASYIYLTALRQQTKAKINVNYGTLMARD